MEQADNPPPLHTLLVPPAAPLRLMRKDGLVTLELDGHAIDGADWDGLLYRAGRPPHVRNQPLAAVPYAAWDNRSPGEMRVWMREAAWPAAE
jgi:DUF1680 family protein